MSFPKIFKDISAGFFMILSTSFNLMKGISFSCEEFGPFSPTDGDQTITFTYTPNENIEMAQELMEIGVHGNPISFVQQKETRSVKANIDDGDVQEAIHSREKEDIFLPQPPLLRLDYETERKLLQTTEAYPVLNNHLMFLALSDKLFDRYSDFFLEPHSTKIIWSTHKVVYVFTHILSEVSMYYDIDLKEPLPQNMTGGHPIKSTTIITKNKIFVPIPIEMYEYFDLHNHQVYSIFEYIH